MKKKMKLYLGLLSAMTLGAAVLSPVISNANVESEITSGQSEIEGVTQEKLLPDELTFSKPTNMVTRGYSHPTKKWDGKKYNIPQTAIGNGNYVYTNVYFSGKSSYDYYFCNTGVATIEIQLKNISSHAIYKKITLKKGETIQTTLITTGNWYAQFKGAKDYAFTGWIK